jgi:hypothetical protein
MGLNARSLSEPRLFPAHLRLALYIAIFAGIWSHRLYLNISRPVTDIQHEGLASLAGSAQASGSAKNGLRRP